MHKYKAKKVIIAEDFPIVEQSNFEVNMELMTNITQPHWRHLQFLYETTWLCELDLESAGTIDRLRLAKTTLFRKMNQKRDRWLARCVLVATTLRGG